MEQLGVVRFQIVGDGTNSFTMTLAQLFQFSPWPAPNVPTSIVRVSHPSWVSGPTYPAPTLSLTGGNTIHLTFAQPLVVDMIYTMELWLHKTV